MTFTPAKYDLRVSAQVTAVQWTEEAQALELVHWIEDQWSEESGGAYFDETVSGAGGPKGEDWGELTIDYATVKYEVAPFDWIVIDVRGRIWVLSPVDFESAYQAIREAV